MRKAVINFLSFILVALLFVGVGTNVVLAAPHLTLTPVDGNYSNGSEFKVTVGVNSDGQKSSAVDVWGTFDKSKLEIVNIDKAANPAFDFDMVPVHDDVAGTFQFSCPSNNPSSFEDTAINGELAVITFKAKATGTAALNFTCNSGSTTDSNIFSEYNDVIGCSYNSVGAYIINSSSSSSSTTTATSTPTPTTTNKSTSTTTTTTTTLPQTGSVGTTLGLIVFGAISLASAIFLKFL